jgi:hypothetical protein
MKIAELLLERNLNKGMWELMTTTSDKEAYGDELVNLVKTAYSNTNYGSFIQSVQQVLPSDWRVLDWDQDPDIDVCIFYRGPRAKEVWRGYKIQGIGHDGQRNSKDKAIYKTHELLSKPGWWLESSDAMRHILKKLNTKSVTDERTLKKLFNDPNLRMIDDDTYTRTLSDGKKVTETVFGNPII